MKTPNNCRSISRWLKVNPNFRSIDKPGRSLRIPSLCLIAQLIILFPSLGPAQPEAASPAPGATFLQIPKGAPLISVPLAVVESSSPRSQGYLSQRVPRPQDELASVPPAVSASYVGKEFLAYQIAALPDGTRYLVVLNEDTGLKFLNRNDSAGNMWYARIYRVPKDGDAKPELVKGGYQSSGNDVMIPVQLWLPDIGTTKTKSFNTEIGYSINGYSSGKPQVYTGRGTALQVSGSHVTPEGKLTLMVTVPDELTVTPETQVVLRFEPLQPGLPEHTASGKISDFLTLGAARFAVTGVTPDFASATLALMSGSLEQTMKQQLQLGSQLPAFAQVDLITRKTVTQTDVLAKAKGSAGVVFVFGDLEPAGGRGSYPSPYRMPGSTALPLPAADVVEQLAVQMQPKPIVVIVTRAIGLDFLYSDLRNKLPEYFVLADYADPLRTMFRQSGGPGWYGGPPFTSGQEPSLRQLFNLPANTLAIVAFDQQGKVRYVKADAAASFLPSLAEARAALGSHK